MKCHDALANQHDPCRVAGKGVYAATGAFLAKEPNSNAQTAIDELGDSSDD